VRIGAFEIEGQTSLGIDQQRVAAELNLFELLRLAAANGIEQTVVRSGRDFANVVVREAFRKISDAIGIALLVAIGDFGRSGDGEFGASGGDTIQITFLGALRSAATRA
jgi:hypothetical protein